MKEAVLKTIKDPGVLFSVANVFAFWQSHSITALVIAFITTLLAVAQTLGLFHKNQALAQKLNSLQERCPAFLLGDPQNIALRINAFGTIAASIPSLVAGAFLPGFSGLFFSVGNLVASSPFAQNLQRSPQAAGLAKALTNAAVYFGGGYILIGLMAGGGSALFADPTAHSAALLTTLLGACTIILGVIGLMSGGFKDASAPLMMSALGCFINMIGGLLSGNILGVLNNLFPIGGTMRLAFIEYQFAAQTAPTQAIPPALHGRTLFWDKLSKTLVFPLTLCQRL